MPLNPSDTITLLTERIIGSAIAVHRALGPGLLESAYQACLARQFKKDGLRYARELPLAIDFEGERVDDCAYRLDFLVEDAVVVEIKSVARVAPIHIAQMITYIRLTRCLTGLILNFNVPSMRLGGIRRVDNKALMKEISLTSP